MKNKFIVIEGLEGSGKSSALKLVIKLIRNYGIKDIIFTREPGGTRLSEALRTLLKKKSKMNLLLI